MLIVGTSALNIAEPRPWGSQHPSPHKKITSLTLNCEFCMPTSDHVMPAMRPVFWANVV